ncbi:MAG TPA: hypothetical protein VJ810_36925 [Blastocatellia bacterium]|nr:hypothetical protein [Blastocatellia bacterium]
MDHQATQFQSGDQSRETADSPLRDSPLINRLAQRGAAPIGLIDTHHPRHLHARASGWTAERFGWMEHLRKRHLNEGVGPAPQASLGDGARRGLLNGVDEPQSDGPLIARKVAPVDAQQGSSSPEIVPPATDSPSSLARVSRRGPQMAPAASVVQRQAGVDKGRRSGDGSATATTPSVTAAEALNIADSPSPLARVIRRGPQTPSGAFAVQRKVKVDEVRLSGDDRPRRRPAAPGVEVPIAEKTSVLSSSLRPLITSTLDESPAASMRETAPSQMNLTGRPITKPIPVAAQSMPWLPVKGGDAPAVQRKVDTRPGGPDLPPALPSVPSPSAADPVAGRAGGVRGEGMIRDATAAQARPGSMAITGASKNAIGADSAPPTQLIQRRSADHRVAHFPSIPAQSPALAPAGGAHELPQMIWRKAEAGEQSRPLTGPSPLVREPVAPMIARQIDSGSPAFESGATVRETTTTGTAPPAPGRGLNLAHLAEQVSRVLTRQLEAERERRGMKR